MTERPGGTGHQLFIIIPKKGNQVRCKANIIKMAESFPGGYQAGRLELETSFDAPPVPDHVVEGLKYAPVNVAVEAAVRQGWDEFIGREGIFVGMTGFGASAPYGQLYERFGITAEAIAEAAISRLAASV